jgi:hypothetical protein
MIYYGFGQVWRRLEAIKSQASSLPLYLSIDKFPK